MPTMPRFRRLASFQLLAAVAVLMPSIVAAQQPTTATLTVSPDGTSASVAVAGPGNASFAASRVIVRFRNAPDFLPGTPGASRVLSRTNNVHLVNTPAGRSVAET